MRDSSVHAVTGRAEERQVGGWQTDPLSHLGALLRGVTNSINIPVRFT